MQTLYATCGLAFSGQTTLAKRLAEVLDIPLISLDDINSERGLYGGEGMTDAQWEETSAVAVERLNRILASGQSAVLDDTLSHRLLRNRYRDVATNARAGFVLLFVDTTLEEIEERMRSNHDRPVRHHVKPMFLRPIEIDFNAQLKTNSLSISRRIAISRVSWRQ